MQPRVLILTAPFPPASARSRSTRSAVGGRAVGAYITGNVIGGFVGRYLVAAIAERTGWQSAFIALGALDVAGGTVVMLGLPRSTKFVRRSSALEAIVAMGRFVRDPVLLATYVGGGSVLFTIVAAFTYATYHLAAAPFRLGTLALGNVFFVFLVGVVVTPFSGSLIDAVGYRLALLLALAVSATGMLVTLLPSVGAVVAGLALFSIGVFASQAASQGFVGVIARSTARRPPHSTSPSTTSAAASAPCSRQPSGRTAAAPRPSP
jgi:YNFM family putative membrane transporter